MKETQNIKAELLKHVYNGTQATPLEKAIILLKQQGLSPRQISNELSMPIDEVYKVLVKFIQNWN